MANPPESDREESVRDAMDRLSETFASLKEVAAHSDYFGPPSFTWLVRGRLGGMQQPGLTRTIENDLEALQRLGVGVLVTLTEEWQPPAEQIAAFGMESIYCPIADMKAPSIVMADELCAQVDQHVSEGRAVVFHCRAGKGRTGTMLASQMIWYEPDHATAINYVKSMNRAWIESDEQLRFLEAFAFHRRRVTDRN